MKGAQMNVKEEMAFR